MSPLCCISQRPGLCSDFLGRAVQLIRAMDPFCGPGGLAFADHEAEHVAIRTDWAIDHCASAAATFQANHPSAPVSCTARQPACHLLE